LESDVLTTATEKRTVFCDVTTYSLVYIYRRFKGPCCLHYQSVVDWRLWFTNCDYDDIRLLWNVAVYLPDYTVSHYTVIFKTMYSYFCV